MSMTKTKETVLALIEGAVPGVTIKPETDGDRIFKELGIDSLDKMMVFLAVQDSFDQEFSPEDVAEVDTFNDLCGMVDKYRVQS